MFEVFVCACDKYQWIFSDFMRLADKNLPYPYKFFSEYILAEGITPVMTDVWREKMLICLNALKSDDVIYLQEDFLTLRVDKDIIEEAYQFHRKKNAQITKLGNNYEFHTHKLGYKIGQYQVYLQNPSDEYLMSHQPVAIYDRKFLIKSLEEIKPENASVHEIAASAWMRENGLTRVYCFGEPNRPKNYSEIFHFEHAIRKGELLPDAMQYLKGSVE